MMESQNRDSGSDEDASLWDDNENTWCEMDDEPLKIYVGSGEMMPSTL